MGQSVGRLHRVSPANSFRGLLILLGLQVMIGSVGQPVVVAAQPGPGEIRLAGTYASRYGLYNYRRQWYSMPYRYRSYYYRPWYMFPPSTFVTPKNYSYSFPPGWSLPWPYPYDLALPAIDPWNEPPPDEFDGPPPDGFAGPPPDNGDDCLDPPPLDDPNVRVPRINHGGRYYW